MKLYTLHEPATGVLRYIGITKQPLEQRLYEHLHNRNGKHRARWVAKIGKPEIRSLLSIADYATACILERFFIASARHFDFPLVNMSGGGEGIFNPCIEHRIALRDAAVARMSTPAAKQRSKERQQKLWADPEFRCKTTAAIRASREVAAAKIGNKQKQLWSDPVFAAASKQRLIATAHSVEAQEKRRLAGKQRWEDPEFRARQVAGVRRNWEKRKMAACNESSR